MLDKRGCSTRHLRRVRSFREVRTLPWSQSFWFLASAVLPSPEVSTVMCGPCHASRSHIPHRMSLATPKFDCRICVHTIVCQAASSWARVLSSGTDSDEHHGKSWDGRSLQAISAFRQINLIRPLPYRPCKHLSRAFSQRASMCVEFRCCVLGPCCLPHSSDAPKARAGSSLTLLVHTGLGD